jgi:hypothetical protein
VAPPKIDGRLDDRAWFTTEWTHDFVDIEGDTRPRPRFRTRVKMLWDAQFFYVAAELDEPHVWATLTKHDSVIFHDNDFEVFIDPDGDNHAYYELEINALNTEWDLFLPVPYRDGGKARDDWEIPGLKTAVHVNGTLNDPTDRDTGWSVELAIPWAVLGEHARRPAPPRPGDRWRVNFSRVEWRTTVAGKTTTKVPGAKEDNWVWSPQGVVDMHRPERWGYVEFRTDVHDRTYFRTDPTLAVRDFLMSVYYAEQTHWREHKAFAASIPALTPPPGVGPLSVRLLDGGKGFEASVVIEGALRRTATVRHDSRLSIEPPVP